MYPWIPQELTAGAVEMLTCLFTLLAALVSFVLSIRA
jgi:hypothetical protein